MRSSFTVTSALLLATAGGVLGGGRAIPSHLAQLRKRIVTERDCKNKLASGFHSSYGEEDKAASAYCGDLLESAGVIYQATLPGELTNMDIDCDGVQDGLGSDGRCHSSGTTQPITSFKDVIQSYGIPSVPDLNPYVHSYAVFGNEGRPGWPTFEPRSFGVEPLSVMVILCGNRMYYGVWGDENGPDGDIPVVGEASIGLATACFGKEMNGNYGHSDNDVLYLAFTGQDAVPGNSGAKWAAQTFDEFEASLVTIGDKLVKKLEKIPGNGQHPDVPSTTTTSTTSSATGRPTPILEIGILPMAAQVQASGPTDGPACEDVW